MATPFHISRTPLYSGQSIAQQPQPVVLTIKHVDLYFTA
jgi:hypothetical protein